ncbi:MAG: hypothetical protein ACXWB0_07720 [Sulfuricurvum sp.]
MRFRVGTLAPPCLLSLSLSLSLEERIRGEIVVMRQTILSPLFVWIIIAR